ncbi:MAG: TonB-dependent receptor [Gracilimonas sp.]|uniref:TonB-dependent receptor domain-containing protein n=1 Tax=Gracilimonas TaxID=649462 RepID=UPI001B15F6DF|nr:TonB-dependent receptor [Gracilimonas sp.]MBO6585458.1 TonB-dependent receptor [Gracilimonas sp.]MBO6616454.1 TonB-dependent receptor [Gracilimonas sp.]
MMKLKAFSFFALCVLFALPAAAQINFSGYVVEKETGEPIEGVDIYNNDAGKSYVTNEEGYFEIKDLPYGNLNLFFFKLGYKIINRTFVPDANNAAITIELEKLSEEMSEIAVIDQRDKVFAIKRLREVEGTSIYAGKKNEVISLDQMVANTSANNARQIYGQISGLNIFESNDAGLQLNIGGRGLDPNRSSNFNIRQNGYDISADVLGYPESYYTPPAEGLAEIQVIRGAASLQYGTQFGGLVNFKMKKPADDKRVEVTSRQSVGSNALFTSFNSVSGTSGKVGYYGYYNYKNGDGFRPNSGFESNNLYLYSDVQISEKTNIALDFTYLNYLAQQPGGLTDAQFYRDPTVSNRTRNWFEVDWKLASLNVEHEFSYKTKLSFLVYGLDASRKSVGFRTNRVSQQDDPNAPRDLILGDFNNWGTEVRFLNRYRIGNKNAVFLIGSKWYQSKNTSVQGPGTTSSKADFTLADEQFPNYPNQSDFTFPNRNLAVFGENIFYLQDNISITPGFRFEYIRTQSQGTFKRVNFDLAGNPIQNQTFEDDRTFERHFVLLGAGVSYLPDSETELYGNFSQNYRSVTFNDIRIVNPTFQVDPDITDESGFTSDVGIRGRIGESVSYDIGGFGLLYDNRIGEVLRAETRINADGEKEETGRVVRYRGNIGQAFMYGLESLIEVNLMPLFGNKNRDVKLSVFANTAITKSDYIDSEIPGVEGNQVEFVPLLNMKTGLNFGYQNLVGSIQYTYVSEQYTDASNAEQNFNDNQSGIRGAIPAYDVLDLSLSWTYKNFTIESGINNVLDSWYFTRRATGYPGPGIIPSPPRTFYATLQLQIGK